MGRDYNPIMADVRQKVTVADDLASRMQAVVDSVWQHLRTEGVSWVGFYLRASDGDEMVLAPHRDKPACSPIGMHGACGQAWRAKRTLVVRDVKELGEGYIACDSRDQSELVIPFYYGQTVDPRGVLDLDSFDLGAFDETDVQGFSRVLAAAGLATSPQSTDGEASGITAQALPPAEAQFVGTIESIWATTRGDPRICIAVLDGPVDRTHRSLVDANLTCLETLASCEAHDGPAAEHGTHVASIIFGQHGKGPVRGVAPACRGIVVPIFGDSDSSSLRPCSQIDLARAILHARENGAHVINISAGQFEPSGEAHPLLADAVRSCAEQRILIVSAVGNDGCECLHLPGALPNVLAVGAMDSRGEPLGFSNWGGPYKIQGILAPGEKILGARPGGGTLEQTGTSAATAIVSGIAGLLLSLQLSGGKEPDPVQVRVALLDSAIGCEEQPAPDCRRILAGRLNVTGAMSRIEQGMPSMPDSNGKEQSLSPSATEAGAPVEPAAKPLTTAVEPAASHIENADRPSAGLSPSAVAAGHPAERTAPPVVEEAAELAGVEPSACTSGCTDSPSGPQLAYAIGQLGYDFGTEARRDSIMQHMTQPANPHDPGQLLEYLGQNPWDAASIIWTLNLDATPVYAVQGAGPFADSVYELLRRFLKEQLEEGVECVSIPGFIVGQARLFSGQVVPTIVPQPRGMYSWTTAALIENVAGTPPREEGPKAEVDAYTAKLQGVRSFLDRVYHGLRNLGITAEERAINYAATNAFQVAKIFEEAAQEGLVLDDIAVERSPICRPDSDCWDVKLIFFNPKKRIEEARKVYRFTVDVSDVVPVLVGEVRSWDIY